jgi:hypothetical protein
MKGIPKASMPSAKSTRLPPTKPKSMAFTPSPTMRFMKRWPKISTMSTTPDARM